MAHAVLFAFTELCEGAYLSLWDENRIIAKAILSPTLRGDCTLDAPLEEVCAELINEGYYGAKASVTRLWGVR